jgi:hypothetical protein
MWDGLATSGTAEVTMPLFAYFTRVGAALLALLLLLNVMLKPDPEPAAAGIANSTAKPRMTTGSAQPNGTAVRTARGEAQPQASEAANWRQPEQIEQLSTGRAERKSVTQAEPKSKTAKTRVRAQNITAARRHDRSAYSSYARDDWYFSAERRHAPQ